MGCSHGHGGSYGDLLCYSCLIFVVTLEPLEGYLRELAPRLPQPAWHRWQYVLPSLPSVLKNLHAHHFLSTMPIPAPQAGRATARACSWSASRPVVQPAALGVMRLCESVRKRRAMRHFFGLDAPWPLRVAWANLFGIVAGRVARPSCSLHHSHQSVYRIRYNFGGKCAPIAHAIRSLVVILSDMTRVAQGELGCAAL